MTLYGAGCRSISSTKTRIFPLSRSPFYRKEPYILVVLIVCRIMRTMRISGLCIIKFNGYPPVTYRLLSGDFMRSLTYYALTTRRSSIRCAGMLQKRL